MKKALLAFLLLASFAYGQSPTATLTVTPAEVAIGGKATLTWTSTEADYVEIATVKDGKIVATEKGLPLNGSKLVDTAALGETRFIIQVGVKAIDIKETKYKVVPKAPDPQPDPDPQPGVDPNVCLCTIPAMKAEHEAVLRLVPQADATHTVVASGLYSNPATWGGAIPTDGAKVIVPTGKRLTSDADTARLKWLRVDGEWETLPGVTVRAELIVGTAPAKWITSNPDPRVMTRFIILDNGPLDTATDPFHFGRAVIWHGSREMSGASKTTWTTHAIAKVGDTQVIVADATGWQPGDKLVLPQDAVQYANYVHNIVNRDDEVIVAAIDPSGINPNLIKLDRPLKFDHKPVTATVKENGVEIVVAKEPVVMNLSRNVVVESESPINRGHDMSMHNPNTVIRFVEFKNLGRTDKSKQVTDPDGKGGGLANTRGRYSLHIHRTGVDAKAVEITGASIHGVVGWGLTNHDSNVNADRCVAYNGFGALFVTELGNEKGSFTNCAAARVNGSNALSSDPRINDPGHFGDCFWLRGQHVTVTGNVAIAARNAGFTFFSMFGQGITFKNNVGLYQNRSLIVWDVGGNGPGAPPFTPNNIVEGNFLHGGVHQGYSSRMMYRDNTISAFDATLGQFGFGHTGVNTHIHHVGNRVVGFQNGVLMPTEGESKVTGGYYDNLQTNLYIQNTQNSNPRKIDIEGVTFGPRATWNVSKSIDFFSFSAMAAYPRGQYMSSATVPPWQPLFKLPYKKPDGTDHFIDGLGHPNSLVTLDGKKLYFEEQGAAFKFGEVFTRFPAEIRFEPDGTTLATTASLAARGKIVGGEALPAGEQFYIPKVRGVLVR